MRKLGVRYLLGGALWLAASVAAFGQQTPPASDQALQETIRLSTDLVVLDVQVLQRKTSDIVNGLKVSDFELYENGGRQEISHFSQDRLPLSVILLMDLSGSVSPALREIQSGALLALERLREQDEVAVIAFSSETQLVQDFTSDRRLILDRIGRIEKTPLIGQGTSLYEGLREAARHMSKARNPISRRVIIAVTDNIAWEYRDAGLTQKEVGDAVIESGSLVCGLVVEGAITRTEKIFSWNRPGQADAFRRKMSLEPFTALTGGEVLKADKTEVNTRLRTLIDHLRTRYSIGFSPAQTQIDGEYHRVSLTLTAEAQKRLGDVIIRTRQGYFARRRNSN